MQFCFIRDDISLTMPVTPGRYQWSVGKRMETINISELGDVYLPGGRTRFSGNLEFLLPAHSYSWMEAGARPEPQYYLDYLNAWAVDARPVRLVITETEINTLVYIEEVAHVEKDGTRDLYVTVSLREYVDPEAPEVDESTGTGNYIRAAEPSSGKTQSYTIQPGDTLSVICRRFYGKSTAKYYNALAVYNDIPNPHLIYPGRVLRIPPEAILFGGGAS